jgi:hypothetical protein
MQLINNQITDILAGYERIRQAETEVMKKWRGPLLAHYARQHSAYESALREYQSRHDEMMARIRLGMWLSSAALFIGLLILPVLIFITELGDLRGPLFCFAPLLILVGLTGWAIVAVIWYWQRDQKKPIPPAHPFKSRIIDPLLPAWREGLLGKLPSKKPYEGATGEYHFVARLQSIDSDSFILYRLQQQTGNDIDVTIVGPLGIWVFEVKYLKGIVRWRDGWWSQRKTYRGRSGMPVTEIREAEEAYDQQWRRMTDSVIETLRRRAPDLVDRIPKIIRIRGGLVFTHPQGKYDIPPGSPFNWGIIPFWIEKLRTVPPLPEIDEKSIFQILDVLLERHVEVAEPLPQRSMLQYAEDLILQASERIRLLTKFEEESAPVLK